MLTNSSAWRALQAHRASLGDRHLRDFLAAGAKRSHRYHLHACGLSLDYSRNHLHDETLQLLVRLAEQQELAARRTALFSGEPLNISEGRAALHTALRSPQPELWVAGENIMPRIHAELNRIEQFVTDVRSGRSTGYSGRRFTSIVNIGIGGSSLGPQMVVNALRQQARGEAGHSAPRAFFVSHVDAAHFDAVAEFLAPETTLFIIASKTFTTRETLLNAHRAKRWFIDRSAGEGDWWRHCVAVSADPARARSAGFAAERIFSLWDWVGGRYSLWSAMGLTIALRLGMTQFHELLAGAQAMDQHFCHAPLRQNMPVLLALIGVWYNNFLAAHQQVILTYDYDLQDFPRHIQQLDMESNGKWVTVDGEPVNYATGPTVWGGSGSDAQHAYLQLLHQGTHRIPADFIVAADRPADAPTAALAAGLLAQTHALAMGTGNEQQPAQQTLPGDRPSNSLLLDTLDAHTLGALLALYEHKIFVQGVIWRINSFDQPGIEQVKQRVGALEALLDSGNITTAMADRDLICQHFARLLRRI